MDIKTIDVSFFNEILSIDASSPSGLSWRVRRGVASAGDPAGTIGDKGYWIVKVNKKPYRAHRIIWALTYGDAPPNFEIDHIDGVRTNNCIHNLRLCTSQQNKMNRGAMNGDGLPKGITKSRGYFRARIIKNGRAYTKHGKSVDELLPWIKAERKKLHGHFAKG